VPPPPGWDGFYVCWKWP